MMDLFWGSGGGEGVIFEISLSPCLQAKYRGESSIREIKGNLVTREEEFTRVQAELQTITRDRAHIEVGTEFN